MFKNDVTQLREFKQCVSVLPLDSVVVKRLCNTASWVQAMCLSFTTWQCSCQTAKMLVWYV